MAVSINIGEQVSGTLGLVDHVTGNPVVASFDSLSVSSSDENIVTVIASGNTAIVVTAAGAGTTNINVTVIAAYTDANTGQAVSATKTLSVSVTVSALPQQTDLVITFGTPVSITPAG